ncbi:MAG: YceI family protein [Acidobacteriota bacterium]
MRNKALGTLFLAFGVAAIPALGGSALHFRIADPLGRNTVQFRTTAPLEDIVGTTNQIEGTITVDPETLRSTSTTGAFSVDLSALRTGISLRDSHMREHYLQTSEYPKASFVLQRIKKSSASKLTPNETVQLVAEGTFELHGVKRKVEVPIEITYLPESNSTMSKLPGNLLRVKANFEVRLSDYQIQRPKMVLLKVGEVAHVSLEAFASDANPAKMSMWLEKMKKMMASD